MTERDFIYWLQRFLEMSGVNTITPEQVKIIKDHLSLVMSKVTPTYIPKDSGITIGTFPSLPPYPQIYCGSGISGSSKT